MKPSLAGCLGVFAVIALTAPSIRGQEVGMPPVVYSGSGSGIAPPTRVASPFERAFELDIDVAADGSVERRVRVVERALNAIPAYKISILFNQTGASFALAYVRIVRGNGNVEDLPTSAVIAPRGAAVWGLYFGSHEATLPIGDVRPLDRIEYAYRISVAPVFASHFVMEDDWRSTWFARSGITTLRVPENMPLTFKSSRETPQTGMDNGRRFYRWVVAKTDDYDFVGVDAMPMVYDARWTRPDVQVSTFRTWAEVGIALRDFWGGPPVATDIVRARATELTAKATTEMERIEALYRYVAARLANVDAITIANVPPRAPELVLESTSGTGLEKHRLLEAMLRTIGIASEPALISAGSVLDPDVPSPAQFNHALTVVHSTTGPLWLDVRLPGAPLGFLAFSERNASALRLPADETASIVRTPAESVRPNVVAWKGEGEFDTFGRFTLRATVTLSGDSEAHLRGQLLTSEESDWGTALIRAGFYHQPGGRYESIVVPGLGDFGKPLQVEYTFTPQRPVTRWIDSTAVEVPQPFMWRPDLEPVSAGAKAFRVFLGPPVEKTFDLRMRVPAGERGELVNFTERDSEHIRDFATFRRRVAVEDEWLVVHAALTFTQPEIAASRAEELSEFRRRVQGPAPVLEFRETWPWRFYTAPRFASLEGKDATANQLVAQAALAPPVVGIGLLAKALAIEPAHPRAWSLLGQHRSNRPLGEAVGSDEAFRQQILVAPSADAYKRFGIALTGWERFGEAVPVYREGVAAFPDDRDLPALLGEALLRSGQSADAAAVFEVEAKLRPRSSRLRLMLGRALLESARAGEGVESIRAAVTLESTPEVRAVAARSLADANAELDLALELAQGAVDQGGYINSFLAFPRSQGDIDSTFRMTYYLETMGRVLVRRGELDRAELYCRAAWEVGFRGRAAECLGQIAERRGNAAEAAGFGYAALFPSRDPLPGGGFETPLPRSADLRPPVGQGAWSPRRRFELQNFKVPRPSASAGSALLDVITGPDGLIREVSFLEPPPVDFYGLMASLLHFKLGSAMPEKVAARLLRRVVVTCVANADTPTCDMRIVR